MKIRLFNNWVKSRVTTIVIFAYGIIMGTSTPILLTRCVSSGSGCANCAGFCGVALGILPLVLFVTIKSRVKHKRQRLLSQFMSGKSSD
jgi:hypothetical protein